MKTQRHTHTALTLNNCAGRCLRSALRRCGVAALRVFPTAYKKPIRSLGCVVSPPWSYADTRPAIDFSIYFNLRSLQYVYDKKYTKTKSFIEV